MEAQGLRLDLPVRGAQVPSLVGRKDPHATWHGQKIIVIITVSIMTSFF